MSKLVGLACTAALLLLPARPQRDRFSKYTPIEAYEVRPGVLMMPRYSDEGEVCSIALERLHYSPGKVRLDSGLARKEIDEILEELVPAVERGSLSNDLGGNLITEGGHSVVTNMDFANVSVQIVGEDLSTSISEGIVERDVVATVHWKNRKCRE
jgi:hypothetical protein